jgi:hypothetical protein
MLRPTNRTRTTADTTREEPPMKTLTALRSYARYAAASLAAVAFGLGFN